MINNVNKTYEITDLITVKLENDVTNIYIENKQFIQCKRLLINISPENIKKYKKIENVDEAEKIRDQINNNKKIDEILEKYNYENLNQYIGNHEIVEDEKRSKKITPEEEFWGHCSNLQAWVENDYDPRLLHSNISFPLLHELAKLGILEAKIQLKEGIARRIDSKNKNVIISLLDYISLNVFTQEEISTMFHDKLFLINLKDKGVLRKFINLNDKKITKTIFKLLENKMNLRIPRIVRVFSTEQSEIYLKKLIFKKLENTNHHIVKFLKHNITIMNYTFTKDELNKLITDDLLKSLNIKDLKSLKRLNINKINSLIINKI